MKTNSQLQQDVMAELKSEIAVHAARMGGEVKDGVVTLADKNIIGWSSTLPTDAVEVMVEGGWWTLSGEVEWRSQRQRAADSAGILMGVTGVSNQIAIKPAPSATAVKPDIKAALKRRAIADAKTISVALKGGDVTLTGSVHSWDERALATRTASGCLVVRNVVDNMKLVF